MTRTGSVLGLAALLVGGGAHGATKPRAPGAFDQALRQLHLRYLQVEWDLDRRRVADFTGDGVPDLAAPGYRGRDFAVGFIVGPIGPLSTMHAMFWPESPDAACVYRPGAVLEAEPVAPPPDPLGCRSAPVVDDTCATVLEQDEWLARAAAEGTLGLQVRADACDVVHLYWNAKARAFDSWIAR